MADLEALMRSAQAALTAAAETVPSAEERRAEAAAAEALAASGAGVMRVALVHSSGMNQGCAVPRGNLAKQSERNGRNGNPRKSQETSDG